MNVSFGKFIPVRCFIDGHEIKTNKENVPKEVERATLTLCDCLSKDKNYPNIYLAEQQRRFFASQVKDYKLPKTPAQNKKDIMSSTVKTLNLDGKRYLVTGDDIGAIQEIGHELGVAQKKNFEKAEDKIGYLAENMSHKDFQKEVSRMSYLENKSAKEERLDNIRRYMEGKVLDKTLLMHAKTNPDAKLKRDKYQIVLIDFKA